MSGTASMRFTLVRHSAQCGQRPKTLANKSTKMAHTPTARMPSEDAGCMPAKMQAITTPPVNTAPTPRDRVALTNSPQCLHFLASARISSAQNEPLRRRTSARTVVAPDDMGFSPSQRPIIPIVLIDSEPGGLPQPFACDTYWAE